MTRAPALHNLHGLTMGTTWSVRVVVPQSIPLDALQYGIQDQLDRVDEQMSTYKPASALSCFNAASTGWYELRAEFFEVVSHAIWLASDSGGAYDPTVGPLVNLWGFGPGQRARERPSADAIAEAHGRIGWWKIKLDPTTRQAFQPGGIQLDLSSVAKGYSVDQVGRWLDRMGATAWLVEVGGELKGYGIKPDGMPWRIGIERPDAAAGAVERVDQLECTLALSGRAIATSGDYRHHYEDGGQVYSHHIDPRDGRPVPHAVASVSVLARDALQADPLGTTMTILGPEQGLAYAEARGLAVLFILRGEHGLYERMSAAFAAALRA
ncbi:FAD:protein FMN transferase [Dyella tabacisoli]|uniref:FAD:protein FMN transferase n=1 Tax=Dyella tabacisoli TaxID=2282381 RepID=A0A369UW81_9GAMM|nr:FAD:protein FMN transferase [Dyella tabacisoli]RDD82599.1 FAD:protein FMN transferase [Dyella tabacisoli]